MSQLGEAAVRGLQGASLADPLGVLACAKHYVGDGGTTFGSAREGKGLDQGDTRVDEATLRKIHLPGYITAIRAGVGTIMPSYNTWNGVKCSASKRLLTEILKQELGFEGFLISDYNAIDQLDKDFKKAIGISINAGMDMAMVPTRYREYITDLKALVNEGTVPDVADRRCRHSHPARQVRHRPDGPQPLATRRSQPAEELRLGRASGSRAPGRPRIARAAEERS